MHGSWKILVELFMPGFWATSLLPPEVRFCSLRLTLGLQLLIILDFDPFFVSVSLCIQQCISCILDVYYSILGSRDLELSFPSLKMASPKHKNHSLKRLKAITTILKRNWRPYILILELKFHSKQRSIRKITKENETCSSECTNSLTRILQTNENNSTWGTLNCTGLSQQRYQASIYIVLQIYSWRKVQMG